MSKTVFFNNAAASIFGHATGLNFRLRAGNGADLLAGIKPSTRGHAPRPGTESDTYVKAGETGFGYFKTGENTGKIKSERREVSVGAFEVIKGKLGWWTLGAADEGEARKIFIVARSAEELNGLLEGLAPEDRAEFEAHVEAQQERENLAAETLAQELLAAAQEFVGPLQRAA